MVVRMEREVFKNTIARTWFVLLLVLVNEILIVVTPVVLRKVYYTQTNEHVNNKKGYP